MGRKCDGIAESITKMLFKKMSIKYTFSIHFNLAPEFYFNPPETSLLCVVFSLFHDI